MERKYGKFSPEAGDGWTFPGYTLEEVLDLAHDAEGNEVDLYELTGDLAVGPKLLRELVEHIKELQAKPETPANLSGAR